MRSILPAVLLLAAPVSPRPCPVAANGAVGGRRCDCMTPPPPREPQAQATAVFLGVVDSISPARLSLAESAEESEGSRVRLRVLATWASGRGPGSPTKEVSAGRRGAADAAYRPARTDSVLVVATGTGAGDCGFAFRRGETYLVYASGRPEALVTTICHRTRAEPDIGPELAALGPPAIDRRGGAGRQRP